MIQNVAIRKIDLVKFLAEEKDLVTPAERKKLEAIQKEYDALAKEIASNAPGVIKQGWRAGRDRLVRGDGDLASMATTISTEVPAARERKRIAKQKQVLLVRDFNVLFQTISRRCLEAYERRAAQILASEDKLWLKAGVDMSETELHLALRDTGKELRSRVSTPLTRIAGSPRNFLLAIGVDVLGPAVPAPETAPPRIKPPVYRFEEAPNPSEAIMAAHRAKVIAHRAKRKPLGEKGGEKPPAMTPAAIKDKPVQEQAVQAT